MMSCGTNQVLQYLRGQHKHSNVSLISIKRTFLTQHQQVSQIGQERQHADRQGGKMDT